MARSLYVFVEAERRDSADQAISGWTLDEGQCRSLRFIAEKIGDHGLLLADEVGMGKTRIAVALAKAVIAAGGRVAVLVPPGLGFQWQDELQQGDLTSGLTLRSLSQFLNCWDANGQDIQPWFEQSVVLVSHAFTNWRLGANSEMWRWGLLPEIYAHWRGFRNGRRPRNYHDDERLLGPRGKRDERLSAAAHAIVELAKRPGHQYMATLLDQLIERTPWKDSLDARAYANQAELRVWLERAVGLGLGYFDLVITDEAHKSRGDESGLNRLLEGVILSGRGTAARSGSRRLSMTATPVELGIGQWMQALQRIDIDPDRGLQEAIECYAKSVNDVRKQLSQESARAVYKSAAQRFQTALSPYLLRRDKRESKSVQRFHERSGRPIHAYREESEISIETASLPNHWRQAICAAEALSMLAGQSGDTKAQRLRLTIGNGHGINSVLDTWTQQDAEALDVEAGDKMAQRAQWWKQRLAAAFAADGASLYEHPGILAAVEAIEAADAAGEKVLVFGRFTQPMHALVDLLNARAMLRRLDAGQSWPQALVHQDDWPAVQAAHRQMGRPGVAERTALDAQLDAQYKKLENTRERQRSSLLDRLEAGLSHMPQAARARGLFAELSKEASPSHSTLFKALSEMLGDAANDETPAVWAQAFVDLVEASCDRDEGDIDGDGSLDPTEVTKLWATLAQRLKEEYSRPQGGFARLMHGDTKPPTRRILQMAFNRSASFPRVLVAQSLVGREGLNLHRACRTVVLLHPEWNPGVVEQQIGRVDRIGSRWEQQLAQAVEMKVDPEQWPRIRILPVVFKGTYDEMNWRVLRQRWDELRAQLHGVVIPESARSSDSLMNSWIDEINGAAPDFSPLRDAGLLAPTPN